MKKQIVVSGIRPTGDLHLGNYFGAMLNYVRMQENYDCYFFVADWHALTTHPDTNELRKSVLQVIAINIAAGLDPEKACIFVQSDIPEIAELYLILNTMAYKGELEKTVTFKEKVRQQPENVNAGLLTYPVLQAADILIHRAEFVPVGKDQEQHLEMSRNFAQRFNHRYGDLFPEPQAFNNGKDLIKVPSLDGSGKMSKSVNQMATLYLSDDDATISKKIMKAKTDDGPSTKNSQMPDYIQNIFALMQLASKDEVYQDYLSRYQVADIRYGDMKKQLATDMIAFISPIREKAQAIQADKVYLKDIMEKGAIKARESARATIELMREKVGLNYL